MVININNKSINTYKVIVINYIFIKTLQVLIGLCRYAISGLIMICQGDIRAD